MNGSQSQLGSRERGHPTNVHFLFAHSDCSVISVYPLQFLRWYLDGSLLPHQCTNGGMAEWANGGMADGAAVRSNNVLSYLAGIPIDVGEGHLEEEHGVPNEQAFQPHALPGARGCG